MTEHPVRRTARVFLATSFVAVAMAAVAHADTVTDTLDDLGLGGIQVETGTATVRIGSSEDGSATEVITRNADGSDDTATIIRQDDTGDGGCVRVEGDTSLTTVDSGDTTACDPSGAD